MMRSLLRAAFLVAVANATWRAAAPGGAAGRTHRRLDVAVTKSDGTAATVLSVADDAAGAPTPGIGAADHARIVAALDRADAHARRARTLLRDPRTVEEGRAAVTRAEEIFVEAKALIARSLEDEGSLVRKKYADHDLGAARDDEERALDVAHKVVRHLYEKMALDGKDAIGFNECKSMLVKHCKTMINRYLRDNGLLRGSQSIEIRTFQKRPVVRDPNDEGSNKVIVITNTLGDAVDEVPHFPDGWTWNSRAIGPWPACVGQAPEDCCLTIRNDVADPDEAGRHIECQFYTPELNVAGEGVKYPRLTDAEGNPTNGIILYESIDPDGQARVEETPFIQADFNLPP